MSVMNEKGESRQRERNQEYHERRRRKRKTRAAVLSFGRLCSGWAATTEIRNDIKVSDVEEAPDRSLNVRLVEDATTETIE